MIYFKPKKPAMLDIKMSPEQSDAVINIVDSFGPIAGILKEAKFKSVVIIVSVVGLECVKYHGEASKSTQDFLP